MRISDWSSDVCSSDLSIEGETELKPQDIVVPGDPSSAAFPMVAALLVPGSHIVIENVGLNATRAGLIELLRDMGGNIEITNARSEEHTSELQSLMRISYAVFCLKKKKQIMNKNKYDL